MSEEIALAAADIADWQRRAEKAEAKVERLLAEIRHRARIDAEDMQRIQGRYYHLYRQFEALQTRVARGMALQPMPPIVVEGVSAALLTELTELRAALDVLLAGPTDAAQDRARAALAGYKQRKEGE